MIITRLKINPFGCFSKEELKFKEGLNVILGPNEAGKSTAFSAIQKVLLTPVKLTKPEFKREIERFIPLGGDTIHVELFFAYDGKLYTIKRTWGGTKSAELRLPDGSLVTDEKEIIEQLTEILPTQPGTFKSVLMTYQSGLSRTIEELKKDYPETVLTLGDILRKAILETDGVSIDRFKDSIQRLYNNYYSRWDVKKQYPEKNRGIENPWQKEIGYVLQAFYGKESIRISLEQARRFEEELDKSNQQINECLKKISELDQYLQKNKKPVEDARERGRLNAELKARVTTSEILTKVNCDWPVRESKIEELKKGISALDEDLKRLEKEKMAAEIVERNKEVREKYKRVHQKKVALDEAMRKLKTVKKLTKADFEDLRNAFLEVEKIEAEISAGRLSLQLKAKKEFTLSIQKDFDRSYEQDITPDAPIIIEAGGILKLKHPDWQMNITSGEGNINQLIENYANTEKKYKDLLEKHQINNFEEATETSKTYEKYENEVTKAKEFLDNELNSESYEALELKVKEMGQEKETAPLTKIIERLTKVQYEMGSLKKELEEHEKAIADYREKYNDKTQLLLSLAEEVRQEKELENKISNLALLPEGIDDVGIFINSYDTAKKNLDKEKDGLNALKLKKAEVEIHGPNASAEEIEKQLTEAEEQFNRVIKKGEAIVKIKDLTETLLLGMDSETHVGLKKDLEHYVSIMTGKKYERVNIEEKLPHGFIRKDGKVLSCELLSIGTKDVLSLALRLSMANYFLKEANGFLIMDDPLVDLDPERQKKAAEVLKEYAKQKQVLIFTCHPSHAELLGGHQIKL
jgi:exonuclease SbcC